MKITLEIVNAAALNHGEKSVIREGELYVFAHSGQQKVWQSFTDCPATALGMLAERAGLSAEEYLAPTGKN